MRLTFTGYKEGFNKGEATYLPGHGTFEEGDSGYFPEDVSLFLVTTGCWAETTEAATDTTTKTEE